MIKTFTVFFISVLLLSSCVDFNDVQDDSFWVTDFRNNRKYRISAALLAEGRHCNVWVEKGSGVSEAKAWRIARDYDNFIYDKILDAFGVQINVDGTELNTMQYADWLGNNDGKLCILLLDIKDNYQEGVHESYIAGYFWSGDLYDFNTSNKRDMIYIDINPGIHNMVELYNTLAHEMQHLMNYVTRKGKNLNPMDLWVDEGLSSAAEWIFLEEHPEVRWRWFNNNGNGRNIHGNIDRGNNFFVWGNHRENSYAIIDDYATVYLFFQWLRLQAESNNYNNIYRDIISSSYHDYRAVTTVMDAALPERGYSNWEKLLGDWLAANYINAPDGPYGYMDDPVLKNVKVPFAPAGIRRLNLFPGEGVYSITREQPNLTSQGSNISNVFLTDTVNASYHTGSTMLTFNKNSDRSGSAETGVATGFAPDTITISGRSLVSTTILSGPFPIGARDLLRHAELEFAY